MYLWKLSRVNVVTSVPDTMRSVVVAAETDLQARNIAAAIALDEGQNVWLDQSGAACYAIGEASPALFPYPGIVLADVLEG